MTDITTLGRQQAEELRPSRKKNYKVKRKVDFTCQHEGCEVDYSVLVVEIPGEVVVEELPGLTTRCQKHLTGKIQPGQWDSR